MGFADGEVRLRVDPPPGSLHPAVVGLPFAGIAEAKLVMTEGLIAAARARRPAVGMGDGSDWAENKHVANESGEQDG